MFQDKIDRLITIGALPPGFEFDNPDRSFLYSGDILDPQNAFKKLTRIIDLTIDEIQETLENTVKKSGRYYLYPRDKNTSGGVRIPFDISVEEKEDSRTGEKVGFDSIRTEIENTFLKNENSSLKDQISNLTRELTDLRGKTKEISVFEEFLKLESLKSRSQGETAGVHQIIQAMKDGQELGKGSSADYIQLLKDRVSSLETEIANLKTEHAEEIEALQDELDKYRERVGELPSEKQDEDLTTMFAKSVLEMGKDFIQNNKNSQQQAPPQLTQGKKTRQPGQPMNLEKQLLPIIISIWTGNPRKTMIEAAQEAIPILKSDSMIMGLVKSMSPEVISDFVFSKISDTKIISFTEADIPAMKADLNKLAEAMKKVIA